jgi:hypothetical protein
MCRDPWNSNSPESARGFAKGACRISGCRTVMRNISLLPPKLPHNREHRLSRPTPSKEIAVTTRIRQKNRRAAEHKFRAGQKVTLAPNIANRGAGGPGYVITRQLPERGANLSTGSRAPPNLTSELPARANSLANSQISDPAPVLFGLRHIERSRLWSIYAHSQERRQFPSALVRGAPNWSSRVIPEQLV